MGICIEKADFYGRHILATIQDYGRYGYQNSGVTVSGVVDRRSASNANVLVNNDIREAVIEFMLMGPTIRFTSTAHIAITGADFSPKINGEPVPAYKAIKVYKDDVLEFGLAKGGVWGYIAFAEKLDVPEVMGSRSTNTRTGIGGVQGRALEEGDNIGFREKIKALPNFEKRELTPENFADKEKTIRVILGLQKDALPYSMDERNFLDLVFDCMVHTHPKIPHLQFKGLVGRKILRGLTQHFYMQIHLSFTVGYHVLEQNIVRNGFRTMLLHILDLLFEFGNLVFEISDLGF